MLRSTLLATLLGISVPSHAQDGDAANGSVNIEVGYTADLLGGAGADDPALVNNFDLIVDAKRGDTRLRIYGLYNNGRDFSGRHFPRGFTVSNIETGVKAARLYEAWIEQEFADGQLSVLAGLYDFNSEFDALQSSALLINPAHGIGNDIAQSGENGPSIFPVTSLGLRIQAKASDRLTLRIAVLDGVPGNPARPKRTSIKLGNGDGAFIAGEADFKLDNWRLIGGLWSYTARFDDPLASEIAGASVAGSGNRGLYLRGEGLIAGEGQGRGTNLFFRLGRANGRFNEIRDFLSAGLHFRAPFAARPDDEAGIGVVWSGSSRNARLLQNRLADPITRDEWAFEITYTFNLTDWLTLQPDLQYAINPAFETGRRAWTGGLRISTRWSFGL